MVIIIAYLFVNVEMQQFGKHNYTSEWVLATKDTLYPPLVTQMRDHIVYIVFPSDFTIKLETSKIINKPCKVPASVIKKNKGENISPVYADTLGNGRIVVFLSEESKKLNQSNVWMYVIDPQKCNYDHDKFILDTSIFPVRDVMTTVPYQDSFEVFVRSDVHCTPGYICSMLFSDKPALIGSNKSAIPYDDEDWDLNTNKNFDRSGG